MRINPSSVVASPRFALRSVSPDGDLVDRRSANRRPEFLVEALVFVDADTPPVRCTMRDCGGGGARFEVDRERGQRGVASKNLPDHITVTFPKESVSAFCQIMWRDGRHFGVKFLDGPQQPETPVELPASGSDAPA